MVSEDRKPSIDQRNSVNIQMLVRNLNVRGLKTTKEWIGRNVGSYVAIKDSKKWIQSNFTTLFSSGIGDVKKELAVVWTPTRVQVSECILILTLTWFGDFYFRLISNTDFTLMIVVFRTQTNLVYINYKSPGPSQQQLFEVYLQII